MEILKASYRALIGLKKTDNFGMSKSENDYRKNIKRHVVSARKLLKGSIIKPEDLILKRTLASQMKSAKINQVTATILNQKSEFRANGKTILFPGYMAAYVESNDKRSGVAEDKETVLPKLEANQSLECNSLNSDEHSTKPPARFTEASLVKELEEKGIGRPSTFANIIDTIVRRTYVNRERSKLTPTFLGLAVTQLLENHFNSLVDDKFTATMEDGLDAISTSLSIFFKRFICIYYSNIR